MTTFLSSDWHLGHANMIAYDRRPFRDVAEMGATLIRNYRAVVNDNDRVLFLGDMFFKATKDEVAAIMS
jgi:calcineurin-like phosphoesterase family protein